MTDTPAYLSFRCEHTILRGRIKNLELGISNLQDAIYHLSRAGNSFASLLRTKATAERLMKYAQGALDKLPPCCTEGCRG